MCNGEGLRKELFETLVSICATNKSVILGRDFNIQLGDKGDSSACSLEDLISGHFLKDSSQRIDSNRTGPTWRNSRGVVKRLDYVFISKSVVKPVFFSDHDMIWVGIKRHGMSFGKGYWRLNTQVLLEHSFGIEYREFFKGLKPLYENVLESG